jgi:type IV pilus assembly protein PilE
MHLNHNRDGITLIELLVVIVIVGILAAIAIPTYNGYMERARRADAKVALEQLRAAQEMFRAERGRYANDGNDVNAILVLQNSWGVSINAGDYVLLLDASSPTAFIARAQANTARQLSDGDLFINQNGDKTPADKWAK